MIVVPENFRMTQNFHLVLLLHAHQPCGNFGQVFEKSYEQCYLPFLELLERHPAIHVGLHYSGPLLEWMEENRPDYFALIRQLARRGQVEMVGGGFYEPILIAIPPEDQQEQIARLANYIEHHFGQRPAARGLRSAYGSRSFLQRWRPRGCSTPWWTTFIFSRQVSRRKSFSGRTLRKTAGKR